MEKRQEKGLKPTCLGEQDWRRQQRGVEGWPG